MDAQALRSNRSTKANIWLGQNWVMSRNAHDQQITSALPFKGDLSE
jgi:hypothetical protein